MKKNAILFISLITSVIFLCACKSSNDKNIKYIGAKLTGSELWSIVNIETGDILYKDEFKNEPSPIINDIFYVENDNGEYDYYNISNVKKTINKESYHAVTIFNTDGKALAVKKGGTIHVIDEECNSLVDLGKDVRFCGLFEDGTAQFETNQGKNGIIDENGKIIIKPIYDAITNFHEGLALAYTKENDDLMKISIIDTSGDIVCNFSSKDYVEFGVYNEGALPATSSDGDVYFLDKKGERIAKFGTYEWPIDNYRFTDGITAFKDGDSWGIKNTKGDILIRAKYDQLTIFSEGVLHARKGEKSGIINKNDETIIPFEYEKLVVINEKVFFVGNYETGCFINTDGKDIGKNNFSDIGYYNFTDYVKSNHFDAPSIVKKVMEQFDDESCHEIQKGTRLSDFRHLLTKSVNSYKDSYVLTDSDISTDFVYLYHFNSSIAREKYSYYYGYRFSEGYEFDYTSECKCISICVPISEYEDDAKKQFITEFESQLKKRGYKESKHYFQTPQGSQIGVGYKNNLIIVMYYFDANDLIMVDIDDQSREITSPYE